jgi:D-alanyl-D-alanine carboxypeptidase
MRKGILVRLTALLLLSLLPRASAEEEPELSARCAVLTGPDGQILYARNADERCLIASTTKLMTALVVAERCDGAEIVEIPAACCGIEGSSLYLSPGEHYTVEELLTGLLLVSANDAAQALAMHCAGSVEAFAGLMNEKAAALGMGNSHFVNPHGLNAEGHYSSAADLAKLMTACMDVPQLAEILGESSATVQEQTLYNHNKLLWRCPGCLGGKTGYTQAAGRCLVSCCQREGTRLYCVTLSAPDDWNDHMALYDWGFARYETRDLSRELHLTVPLLTDPAAEIALQAEPLQLFLPKGAELTLRAELPRFVFPPVREGETAGFVTVLLDGQELGSSPLRFAESFPANGEALESGRSEP